MTIVLEQRGEISQGDEDIVSIDYTEYLDETEELSTVDSVLEVGTSDLTISGEQINPAVVNILNREVEIGKAVQFWVADAVEGTKYKIDITTTTDTGRIATRQIWIKCR